MKVENDKRLKNHLGLSKWLYKEDFADKNHILRNSDKNRLSKEKTKHKLAFGHGYNPQILRFGITSFSYSHMLEDGLKLYQFTPKLSYRIFNTLAGILKYKCVGSELRNKNTSIKSDHFVTDQPPEEIVDSLNSAIKKLFKEYDPISD